MKIKVRKAYENNLKNLSVGIPIGKITAITGVSGSGKSTLLKDILGATGARRYSCAKSKTIRTALTISNTVKVESVENLPTTILIDAKSSISNASSTVSTVSGAHEILRNLFEEAGECHCPYCQSRIERKITLSGKFVVDIVCDERYDKAVAVIKSRGRISRECFFDKNKRPLAKRTRAAMFSEILFELQGANDAWAHDFNKSFQCTILAERAERFDPLMLVLCEKCGRVVPRLLRSRLSFNTEYDAGGGMCRHCHGTGVTSDARIEDFIVDEKKSILKGGIRFVSEKGLQFTTINLSMLKIAAKACGVDVKIPIRDIPRDGFKKLMIGSGKPFVIKVKKNKDIKFDGIIASLRENFFKGKGKSSLAKYFKVGLCSSCHGKRIDPETNGLTLWGKTLSMFLSMTFIELRDWCKETLPKADKQAQVYLERLLKKMDVFCRVSCGHLSLDRSSKTLSGGELQRIRVCALLNANVNGVCYLLDEPSSGLHEEDIESLVLLLREMRDRGNTIIMVEHNRKLLRYCDWIVDVGPEGGAAGGTLLFSDAVENLRQFNTQTAKLLTGKIVRRDTANSMNKSWTRLLKFNHLSTNNLKDVSVSLPYGAFTTVCGISGSGKSTFLRDVLFARIANSPSEFGFEEVVYLSQKAFSIPHSSSVATQLNCFSSVIKGFAKPNGLTPECFLPNSKAGKCPACSGRGLVCSEANELIGVCSVCSGRRYAPEVLNAVAFGVSFGNLMETPLSDLRELLPDQELVSFSEAASLLGIGYLTFSRRVNTLSKGEFQRLRLANAIAQSERKSLFLLDEPSRGLHVADSCKLVEAVRRLTKLGNTVVAVEHNPQVIDGSDYIIEFGGTGKDGGYLLYNGAANGIQGIDTPTARALSGKAKQLGIQRKSATIDIEYKVGSEIRRFKNNRIYHLDGIQSAEMSNLAAMTTADFLSVAIPGNSFYSRARHYNETITSTPIIHHVSFKDKIKYEYSLYDLLGLKDQYIASAMAKDPVNSELLRYVFDDSSPTGKCHFCRGRGVAFTVPENFFIVDGALTKDCKAFLRKSVCFMTFSKVLKQCTGTNLFDSVALRKSMPRNFFLYGGPGLVDNDGTTIQWPGMITYFLRNHSHYPNNAAERIFAQKSLVTCPVCSGKMLSSEFIKHSQLLELTYQDLMSRSFSWVAQHLHTGNCTHLNCFKAIIYDTFRLGLGNHSAGEMIQDLTELDSGLALLIAMKHFGFTQSGIAISGIEQVPSSIRKEVDKILRELQKTNTIFIC